MVAFRSAPWFFGGLVLCSVNSAVAQTRDTVFVERELAAARGAARIPLFLELARLRRDQPAAEQRLADSALALLVAFPSLPHEVRARTARSYALQAQGDFAAALTEAQRADSPRVERGWAGAGGSAVRPWSERRRTDLGAGG